MTVKQIVLTALGPYASGKNSDFPRLSESKALSIRWDRLAAKLNSMKPIGKVQ